MAYAAVVTVMQIVENMLHPPLDEHQIAHDKQQIESLREMMNFFHDFLKDSWRRQGTVAQLLERKIRDAAHRAQDTVESYISSLFLQESEKDKEVRCKVFVQELELVMQEIGSIKKKVSMLMEKWDATREHETESLPTPQPRAALTNEDTLIGFDDDLEKLKDRLTNKQSRLQIIPIVGMGGTGKTSLTKNLYNDDYIVEYFDVRAWITVSQQYRVREILLGLLESMRKLTVEMCQQTDNYLSEYLYKSLKGRRYLIIMDDVWTTKVMDEMKALFPDDHAGSRVMITTRLSDVAAYANSYLPHQHHMHFLSDNESWNLLCRKVFREERYPPRLEEVGKKIAQSCKGLPLAIVVIAGLLKKAKRMQHHWEYVAENVNSIVIANDEQCSELLSLSYRHLPHHLKACFLYIGVLPEDHVIHISKLIKLWVAEGFLKSVDFKSLEEVAEEYLEDLISRNLILVGEKSTDGKIKTCSIHDLLRDLCLRKAKEEKFLHIVPINANDHSFVEGIKDPRWLAIHGDFVAQDICKSIGTLSLVRSLLCPRSSWNFILSSDPWPGKLVRVLDMGKLEVPHFPMQALELVHLRYLAFSCDGDFFLPSKLPDYLWNLQTLIIYSSGHDSVIRGTQIFWRMPQLRHLQFEKCWLVCPYWDPVENNHNSVLEYLQTLSNINSSSCTQELFKRTPNLKKLGIWIEGSSCVAPFSLGNLADLRQLEMLKCIADQGARVPIMKNITVPQNLKKLTLKRTRIPWEDMSVVGSLPNLLVLKLIDNAFEGPEWEPIDGQFCRLKYLLIDGANLQYWRADTDHFPRLEQLRLWECLKLEEIPCGVGSIPTLTLIELDDASPSAVASAKQIQEEQENLGNEVLQVSIVYMWEIINQKKMERMQRENMQRERIREEQRMQRENSMRERCEEWVRREETKRKHKKNIFKRVFKRTLAKIRCCFV